MASKYHAFLKFKIHLPEAMFICFILNQCFCYTHSDFESKCNLLQSVAWVAKFKRATDTYS